MSGTSDKELQSRLDALLADCVAKVEALGYAHYDIIPNVRITDNRQRLGSARDVNNAFYRVRGERGKTYKRDDVDPLFQISITTRECGGRCQHPGRAVP